MSIRTAALVILIAVTAASAFAQAPQTNGQIRETIQERIRGIPVEIRVENSTVTLTGVVPTFAQKRTALDMARRTVGVREVVDRITVRPPHVRTDREIMEAVQDSLRTNLGRATADRINIAVADRIVTLTGTLPSSYPKQVAGFLSGLSTGVVDVRNNITVQPTIRRTDAEIAMDLRSRLRRNALIRDQDIDSAVADGVVTLTGTVDTLRQVEQAEAIARFTPGVVDVNNQLFFRN